MKKFLFVLMGVFVVMGAFAAGENVPTSKSYVDSKMAEKQDNIIANDTPKVLTNTGTAGEYGTKGIYDANGEYATQTQNLVDAATMNAGVQNAINSEFQCIEWLDPNDHSSDCLLFNIFGTTAKSASKNLFNLTNSKIVTASNVDITKNSIGYVMTKLGPSPTVRIEFANVDDYLGKTLIVSTKKVCNKGNKPLVSLLVCDNDYKNCTSASSRITIPNQSNGKILLRLYMHDAEIGETCTYYDIMVEEGASATEYEPYKNLYLPAGEH